MYYKKLSAILGTTMLIEVIIPRKGINDDGLGKKHALHKLISASSAEYVWLQDDDIIPPAATPPLEGDLIILPLRMVGGSSLLERLQIAEYAAIQELTMASAKCGQAVLCSGANMIAKRRRWLESWDDLHLEIPSGDDMFLLESFKRRDLTIQAVDEPRYTATVRAIPSWRAFFRQRMRWAGKAPHYEDPDIVRCGRIVVAANVLQLLCPLIIFFKFPIEYYLIKKRDPSVSFFLALLLEVVYPLYMLICLFGGLCRHSRW